MQAEWNAEKEALAKEKEELMQVCKELQDKIKEIKEAKWEKVYSCLCLIT